MAHKFRIYYIDGSTYEGDPFLAPRAGVAVIMQDEGGERGPHALYDRDYYVWLNRYGPGWVNMDWAGWMQYMLLERQPQVTLFGAVMKNDEWFAILRRAKEEGVG